MAKAKESDTLSIEQVPVGKLKIDDSNARAHKTKGIDAIKRSLTMYGQRKPIAVDMKDVVVAGNGTLQAAIELEWKTIAVVRTELKGGKRAGFAIADNRIAELSEWNDDALGAALAGLKSNGGLDDIATGFTPEEMERIVSKFSTHDPLDDDKIPEVPKKPKAKKGDVFVLGNHRLMCGDSTREGDVKKLMGKLKADLVATDPPYMIGYTGRRKESGIRTSDGKDWSEQYIDGAGKNAKAFYLDAFKLILQFSNDHAPFFVWVGYQRIRDLQDAWSELGILDHQMIIWNKKRWMFNRMMYDGQHEQALMGWKRGKKPKTFSNESNSSVWEFDHSEQFKDSAHDHPTAKPVKLFGIPMIRHTREGAICFEPFSGSGSQIIAAEKLNRRCFAMEIEPAFVDVAVTRWEALTKKKAKKK